MSRSLLRGSSLLVFSRRVTASAPGAPAVLAEVSHTSARSVRLGLAGAAALGAVAFTQRAASCAGAAATETKDDTNDNNIKLSKGDPLANPGGNDEVEKWFEKFGPALERFGFGGFCGACAGYALKAISRKVAVVIGIGFLSLQGLAYLGYVDVKWAKVRDDAANFLDADKDGKLTHKDFIILWRQFLRFATFNVPSVGGFASGFALGFYMG